MDKGVSQWNGTMLSESEMIRMKLLPTIPVCPNCGAKLKSKSVKICPKCGHIIIYPVSRNVLNWFGKWSKMQT